MIFELAQDFHDAVAAMPREHPKHRMLELLEEASRRDIHFIARHPTTLFQCMWNTCWWYDCPEAEARYEEPRHGWNAENAPWLRIGPKLHALLEDWRLGRDKRPWLFCHGPPSVSLGSAERQRLSGSTAVATSVAVGGGRIVSGSHDSTVRVWSAATGLLSDVLKGHTDSVRCVAIDGEKIASGSDDRTVRVWHAGTGELIRVLTGHDSSVMRVAIKGERIVSGGWVDGEVRLWDLESGESCLLEGNRGAATGIAIEDDTVVIGGGDSAVRAWDVSSGDYLSGLRFQDFVWDVAVEGERVACATGGRVTVCRRRGMSWDVLQVLNPPEGRELSGKPPMEDAKWRSLAFQGRLISASDPSRARCVALEADYVAAGYGDGTICVWSFSSGKLVRCLCGHSEAVNGLKVVGGQIISASTDGTVRIWDIVHGVSGLTRIGHSGHVWSLAFAGDLLVSGSNDGTVRSWQTPTGRPSRVFTGHAGAVSMVATSGELIVSSSADGSVRVWSASGGNLIRTLQGHHGEVNCVAVTDRRIASGGDDGCVIVWDLETGDSLFKLERRTATGESLVTQLGVLEEMVTCVALSDRRVLSGSKDTRVRVWNAETGECLFVLDGDREVVTLLETKITEIKKLVERSESKAAQAGLLDVVVV